MEEFVSDDDKCVYSPNYGKDILQFAQSSKNIIDTIRSDSKNEMNNTTPIHMSYEMRNIMKSMHSYLDAHFNGEMNNKMEDTEQQFDAKKKQCKKKISDYFPKTQ
ncbi:hypothetical protein TNCV_2818981 [Trichonephila clavipes]|nr:hypothetical protein TNCV_2818981 [Trichonephila clavipes]